MLVGAAVLLLGDGGDDGAQASSETASPATAAARRTPAPKRPSNVGPEAVPMPGGQPLGPAHSPARGQSAGGIPCGSREQLAYHVHARLTIFVDGKPRSVPLGIGIGPPVRTTKGNGGRFASAGSCFSFLHTHAADGIIHIEAPGKLTFKLGQFFDLWQQRLDRRHIGSESGRVVAYVNGKRWRRDPSAIPLTKHAQVQLEIGQPLVAPLKIRFPAGL